MPAPSPARRRAVTLMAVLPWPVVLFQYAFILPGYDKLFREYNLKVDDQTALVLNTSAWIHGHVLLTFLIALALTTISVGIAHAVQSAELSRLRRVAILLFTFGVPCLLFFLTWLTVTNTHRTLVEGLKR